MWRPMSAGCVVFVCVVCVGVGGCVPALICPVPTGGHSACQCNVGRSLVAMVC